MLWCMAACRLCTVPQAAFFAAIVIGIVKPYMMHAQSYPALELHLDGMQSTLHASYVCTNKQATMSNVVKVAVLSF